MIRAVVLDSEPLGLLTHPVRTARILACDQWVTDLLAAGVRVVVPEIIDYELRRELLRANKSASIALLDAFNQAVGDRYLPLTTECLRSAASLWSRVRQQGIPTTDPKALDIDVILAAQALSLNMPLIEFVVATSNANHLSRFVIADTWQNITV